MLYRLLVLDQKMEHKSLDVSCTFPSLCHVAMHIFLCNIPRRHKNCSELTALLTSPLQLSANCSNTSFGGMKYFSLSHDLPEDKPRPFTVLCWHSVDATLCSVLTRLVWAIGLKLQNDTKKQADWGYRWFMFEYRLHACAYAYRRRWVVTTHLIVVTHMYITPCSPTQHM